MFFKDFVSVKRQKIKRVRHKLMTHPLEAFYFTFTSITFFAASALEPPTKI